MLLFPGHGELRESVVGVLVRRLTRHQKIDVPHKIGGVLLMPHVMQSACE